jgi:hypothetical protein
LDILSEFWTAKVGDFLAFSKKTRENLENWKFGKLEMWITVGLILVLKPKSPV